MFWHDDISWQVCSLKKKYISGAIYHNKLCGINEESVQSVILKSALKPLNGKGRVAYLYNTARSTVRNLYAEHFTITSLAGLLHQPLVWRFQEAANILMQGSAWPVFPIVPWYYQYSFTPKWGEAHMDFISCPRMLHSQPTGSTETGTHDVQIQSPRCYPHSHHISMIKDFCILSMSCIITELITALTVQRTRHWYRFQLL